MEGNLSLSQKSEGLKPVLPVIQSHVREFEHISPAEAPTDGTELVFVSKNKED